jgi:hypothetical protein
MDVRLIAVIGADPHQCPAGGGPSHQASHGPCSRPGPWRVESAYLDAEHGHTQIDVLFGILGRQFRRSGDARCVDDA